MVKKKSDLSRAFNEDGLRKTHVGGQALIEGVMMRGKYNWAVAVRQPDGQIYTEEHDLSSGKPKNSWMSWPLVRGCVSLVEGLVLGYKALEISAMHAYDESEFEETEEERAAREAKEAKKAAKAAAKEAKKAARKGLAPADAAEAGKFPVLEALGNPDEMVDALGAQRTLEPVEAPAAVEDAADLAPLDSQVQAEEPEAKDESDNGEDALMKGIMSVSMIIGMVLGVVLFVVVPAVLTNLIVGEYDERTILWNVVDGLLRVAVFVFYIWLIGRMKDIKRMFCYHGAEHKTIHCYEHGLELTPENAASFPRLHVRCGTAFLIMVMIIAILVYTILPVNPLIEAWGVPDGALKLLLVIIVRILFMPVIAGISYEITVKWAGSHPDNPVVKVVLWPGMQMQYLTTNEPDESMLECAIAAMQIVLDREEREAAALRGEVAESAEAPADKQSECSCF